MAALAVIAVLTLGSTGIVTSTDLRGGHDAATTDGEAVQQLAPGLTRNGVTDPWALVSAHRAGLERTSFTLAHDESQRYANDTLRGSIHERSARASDAEYHHTFTARGPLYERGLTPTTGFHTETYADGERVSQFIAVDGSLTVELVRTGPGGPPLPPAELFERGAFDRRAEIYTLLNLFDVNVTGEVTRNGTTLYRVESTELRYPADLATMERVDGIRSASFAALISADGVVHEYDLNYTATVDGAAVAGRNHVEFTDLGATSVEPPEWVGIVPENATTAA